MAEFWYGPLGVVTGAEMAALDREAIDEYRVPQAALMERAGYEVAQAVARFAGGSAAGVRVHVICGSGNNGGDGLVAARALANLGARVRIFLTASPDKFRGDALSFYTTVVKMGLPVAIVGEGDVRRFSLGLRTADVLVDAIAGTGVSGPLRPFVAKLVSAINESGRPVVAVDIATGVQADSGKVDPVAVTATETVTFGLPKIGHLFFPGRAHTGTLRIVDIGFPRPLLEKASQRILTCAAWARTVLRPRPPDGHKGTFGRVVVIAGSRGMAGAAVLALRGALRSGAGLVTWMGPQSLLPLVQSQVPEATARALPESADGTLASSGVDEAVASLRQGDVVALGPGLGQGEVDRFVLGFLERSPVPVVADADALNILARHPKAREGLKGRGPRVITPHPKEAARLLGIDARQVAEAPLEAAARLVERLGCTAVLKGAPAVIQGESGQVFINGSGDVSLATGGTGDVLTGVIASLLAQGYPAETAAALGAYVHGRAGELAGEQWSRHGATAVDVASALTQAWRELERR
ncbi:MAG TPA: NAD(P)H-hydrate dehydratase [Limnochordia bacterium]|nr:NAD(P)H-hydrate dehydratase [Limnochordia bacterium]